MVMLSGGRVRLRSDLLLLLAEGVRGQGVPIFMIGLISYGRSMRFVEA
jgi:hypothetical protein